MEVKKPRLVYVCEGGDCSEKGSVELHNELRTLLESRDPDKLNKLRKYPCFGGCEHGINIALVPDKVFLSKMTRDDLGALVDHLCERGPEPKGKRGIVDADVENIVWELLDTGF